MLHALFYKEWMKTRWFLLITLITLIALSVYFVIVFQNIVERKDISHLLIMMLTRKITLVQLIKYVPIGIGLGMALVQFIPEMYKKCLKLTLHLPFPITLSTGVMLTWGVFILSICFASHFMVVFSTLHNPIPSELLAQSLSVLIPWYAAGFFAYFMVSAIVLEPTWTSRIAYCLIMALGLRIYLLSDQPFAYTHFIGEMLVLIFLAATFSWRSIHRFKIGYQD